MWLSAMQIFYRLENEWKDLYEFAKAAVTKYLGLGDLNNRN